MPPDPSLLSLPTVIWSGIVAALISVCGVVLSNSASISRLKEQLKHDAREKHSDRLASLRRDVYLKLVTDLNRANGLLGALAATDPTDGQFAEPIQTAISELAKLQLIGSRETASLAAEMTALYGEALMRLIGVAKPMHEAQTDRKIANDMYEQSFAQAQHALAAITAENESGSPDRAKLSALFCSFEQYRESYTSYSNERNAAWGSYNAQHKDFSRSVLEEIRRIAPLHIGLTCAIRDEIGLDTDSSELKKRLESNLARATLAVDALLGKLAEP